MVTTKWKSILIIAGTLIIGIIIGSLFTATFLKNRAFDRIAELRQERGFVQRIERIIKPDADQEKQVQQILTNHFDRMRRMGEEMRLNFKAANDSLIKELEPVLRPEQLERFKRRLERMKRFGGPPGPPHRPPHRDKPGKRPPRN
jgi:hypothetical protein